MTEKRDLENGAQNPDKKAKFAFVKITQATEQAPISVNAGKKDPKEFLEALLAPMTFEEFREHWKKSPVVISGGTERRVKALKRLLSNLDVAQMMSESPSEDIKAWLQPLNGGPANSVAVDENTAAACLASGASLYFRAPQEFTDKFVPRLTGALGMNFSSFYPDGALRGETETFVARKGHVTAWHTDFQENFTVQLSGSRKWRFKKPLEHHNIRAFSPHYSDKTNYEQQLKLARFTNNDVEYKPSEEFFAGHEEVVLEAGDILYHPAGVWHQVECESDQAVSINFSLMHQCWGDIIGSGMTQSLWQESELRERIDNVNSPEELRSEMARRLAKAKEMINSLTVDDLCPQSLSVPRKTFVIVGKQTYDIELKASDSFRRSHTASLIPLVDGALESDSEDEGGHEQYALHLNFGNGDYESLVRIVLKVPSEMRPSMDFLRRNPAFSMEAYKDHSPDLLKALLHNGYLVKTAQA